MGQNPELAACDRKGALVSDDGDVDDPLDLAGHGVDAIDGVAVAISVGDPQGSKTKNGRRDGTRDRNALDDSIDGDPLHGACAWVHDPSGFCI